MWPKMPTTRSSRQYADADADRVGSLVKKLEMDYNYDCCFDGLCLHLDKYANKKIMETIDFFRYGCTSCCFSSPFVEPRIPSFIS